MAIELVTGRAGTPHISSADDRAYNAYTDGSGRYLLHGGGCTMQSANNAHLAPAEFLIDGAHVRITGLGEDVTIDNGASSYKRIDIVALHYSSTGGGDTIVETMALEVVKGTPADSDPAEPDMPSTGSLLDGVTDTYIPLYRIAIDGLTPGTPELMLDKYAGGLPSGGEAGYVLKKASATDGDAEWVRSWIEENEGRTELSWQGQGMGGMVGEELWSGRANAGAKVSGIKNLDKYNWVGVEFSSSGNPTAKHVAPTHVDRDTSDGSIQITAIQGNSVRDSSKTQMWVNAIYLNGTESDMNVKAASEFWVAVPVGSATNVSSSVNGTTVQITKIIGIL